MPTSPKAGKNGIAQPYKKNPWDRATFFEQKNRQLHEFERKYDRATGRVFNMIAQPEMSLEGHAPSKSIIDWSAFGKGFSSKS